jgi:biotin-dependent carboxylase-like uncharacterized protein
VSGALLVLEPGPATTVQDLGRAGLAGLGVPRSGALDRGALRAANRLVGNREDTAGLEVTLGGFVVQTRQAVTLAVCGAPGPVWLGAGPARRPVDEGVALTLAAGAVLHVGHAKAGVRRYVAVRGGLSLPATLGSRATDVLSGLGPPPVAAGTVFDVGDAVVGPPSPAVVPASAAAGVVRVLPGPRGDWVAGDAVTALVGAAWTVQPASNRIGLRLAGPGLRRHPKAPRTLASEGVLPGAVQLPPAGQPVVFLADHPTTGGYPVVAVVADADLDALGQLRPGDVVRFRPG